MEQSEQTDKLYPSFLKAQATMTYATKDATNPHLKNRYATFDSVIEAVKEPLHTNGLFYRFTVIYEESAQYLDTYIVHAESSQWMKFRVKMRYKEQGTEQNDGSALSYAKRYGLAAICGIAQADDDASAAVEIKANKSAIKNVVIPPEISPEIQERLKKAARLGTASLDYALSNILQEERLLLKKEAFTALKDIASKVDEANNKIEQDNML